MRLTSIVPVVAATLISLSAAQHDQQVLVANKAQTASRPVNVAIIGAGAAGSSSAYHLAQFASAAGVSVNITVFERNNYVGGRSTTVNAYDDPAHPVELGASIFVEANRILVDAVKNFNLSRAGLRSTTDDIPGADLAIWDGKTLVHVQYTAAMGYWDIAKLLWKYGLAPIRTVRLVKKTIGDFLKMYDQPTFPWKSLTQVVEETGLLEVVSMTGEQYMTKNGITGAFGHDIVQASTRVNYAQNLKHIHGLEAMVCMATDGAMAVEGGNWKIFDHMLKASGAKTLLNTSVSSLERQGDSYRVNFHETSDVSGFSLQTQAFDTVILAAPYQYANLNLHNQPTHGIPDEVPYVQLHVTLFTSPHLIAPSFVNQAPGNPAPKVILTTLPPNEEAKQGPGSCGTPGFFSISLLRPLTNPTTRQQEYLYKIFSPSPVNSTFFAHLLGLHQPHDYTTAPQVSFEKDITWIYRKIWNSYPYEYPRVTFEEIQLDPGLWYTGGMDSFISTMETNALMGKNVAKLIVEKAKQEAK